MSSLKTLQIASPCAARWEAMAGDERKRFCGECRKNVYNLSAMTATEAEALLQTAGADGRPPCVRFYRRADGTVLTSDCPIGVRLAERARRRMAAVRATAALVLAFLVDAFGGPDAPAKGGIVMGAPPPQPPPTATPQPKAVQGGAPAWVTPPPTSKKGNP